MRVVVVGASGNVGTAVLRVLATEPAVTDVVGIARRSPEWSAPKVTWSTADIASDDLAPLFAGADAVVHLAWMFQPTHDPVVTWDANVGGTGRVLAAVAAAGVPTLVVASSVGAYSPGPKDRRVDESWPTDGWPTAGYTREKAYVERLLDTFERDQPTCRVVRLRPGFIFQREAATEQRRIFGGPFVPQRLVRPGLIPIVPDLPGLRFQAVHAADVADAFRRALIMPVRGAFNVAADPVVDAAGLAELLKARVVRVPTPLLRTGLAAAWRLHLVPASPDLFDAVLRVPLMDTTRAREELGWEPAHSSLDALGEFFAGLREVAGLPTPPLHA